MATTSVPPARATEALQIHLAVCRARRAGLACSACRELAARAGVA